MSDKVNRLENKEEFVTEEVKDIKNKKNTKIIIVIICILIALVFGIGGWFLGTKFADKEDKNNTEVKENINDDKDNKEEETVNDTEDETVDTDEAIQDDEDDEEIEFIPDEKVVSTVAEEFNVMANGSSTILKSNYEITKRKVLNEEEKEIYVYALYREVYFVNKKIADKHMLGVYETLEEARDDVDSNAIKDYKTMKDSKTNELYLLVNIGKDDRIYDNSLTYWDSSSAFTYILNFKGDVLGKIKTKYAGTGVMGVYVTKEDTTGRYYIISDDVENIPDDIPKDHKYVLYPDNRILDLHENYLYYFSYQDGDDCSSSEHKVIIENGKIIDTKVKTFDDSIVDSAGQTC